VETGDADFARIAPRPPHPQRRIRDRLKRGVPLGRTGCAATNGIRKMRRGEKNKWKKRRQGGKGNNGVLFKYIDEIATRKRSVVTDQFRGTENLGRTQGGFATRIFDNRTRKTNPPDTFTGEKVLLQRIQKDIKNYQVALLSQKKLAEGARSAAVSSPRAEIIEATKEEKDEGDRVFVYLSAPLVKRRVGRASFGFRAEDVKSCSRLLNTKERGGGKGCFGRRLPENQLVVHRDGKQR